MRNEMTFKKINGITVPRVRGVMKSPKIFKDPSKYNRKTKHKGERQW